MGAGDAQGDAVTSEYVPAVRQAGPPAALRARVEAALGRPAVAWTAPPTGLSAAHRYSVLLRDGTRVL